MLILKNLPTLFINIFQDFADADIDCSLQSPAQQIHPFILWHYLKENFLGHLLWETLISAIDVVGGNSSAVCKLIVTYYIFDLDYPRQYAMVMAFLQNIVMGEPYLKESTKKIKFFVKKFMPLLKMLN